MEEVIVACVNLAEADSLIRWALKQAPEYIAKCSKIHKTIDLTDGVRYIFGQKDPKFLQGRRGIIMSSLQFKYSFPTMMSEHKE